MESHATEAARNTKVCPNCKEVTTAQKRFCPSCGAKHPEHTLAQGSLCPSCGKQSTPGTKFCQECGAKLPFAAAEEQEAANSKAAVLALRDERLLQYPKWNQGGIEYELQSDEGYTEFSAIYNNDYAARMAVNQYKEYVKQNGFREAGQYPDRDHLYKMVAGTCYHADFEHCFDGGSERSCIYFTIGKPTGGFDYVKPQPKMKPGLIDLSK